MSVHLYASRTRKVHYPKSVVLTDLNGIPDAGPAIFRVPLPDPRVRALVTVVYDLLPGISATPPVYSPLGATTLWLGLEQYTDGRQNSPIPVGDLITNPTTGLLVPRSSPLSIPTNAGLMGWSQEFVSIGDQVLGEVFTTYSATPKGRWMLFTRYAPEPGYNPSDDEWLEIVGLATPHAVQALKTGGGNF